MADKPLLNCNQGGFAAYLCRAYSLIVDDTYQNGPWTNNTATQNPNLKTVMRLYKWNLHNSCP